MPRKKASDWEKNWIRVKRLGKGGQGTTFVVTSRGEMAEGSYVLKLLNQQHDLERRKRMYREVAALRTLDHPGIPKYVDSNVDRYKERDIDLYLVTELIPGPTLLDAVDRPLGLEIGTRCILQMLSILEYCHKRDIVHRDIKPQNIIIRNGDYSDPVLLDFGLSFNQDDESLGQVTESWEQLGNRFLRLPELTVRDSGKRDPRSDITSCCGILFYIVTGIQPVALLDHMSRMPHQTEGAKAHLHRIQAERLALLNHVFDRGFNVHIDRRWQSIPALRGLLVKMMGPQPSQPNGLDLESKLEEAEAGLQSLADYSHRSETILLLRQVADCVRSVGNELLDRLKANFSTVSGGPNIDPTTYTYRHDLGFVSKLYPDRSFSPRFMATITGNELIVTAEESGTRVELVRAPSTGFDSWAALRTRVREYFVDGIYDRFSNAGLM